MTLIPEPVIAQRTREWSSYDGAAVEMDTGARLHLDPSCDYSRKRFLYRKTEAHELALMRESVAAGDDVIDVGANIGYWTTAMAGAVGPSGRVFAFEPLAGTYRLLQKNVLANYLHNVALFNVALSDRDGEALLAADRSQTHQSHLVANAGPATEAVPVMLSTLDRFEPQLRLDRLSFLKIDVEGHEVAVLRGAKKLLSRATPTVLAEYNGAAYDRAGYRFSDLQDICADLSLTISIVFPDDDPAVPAGLLDATPQNLPASCNLLLRRA